LLKYKKIVVFNLFSKPVQPDLTISYKTFDYYYFFFIT